MKNKIVLITGAATGIGKQAAIELAALGATVLLHARTSKEGEQVLNELQTALPAVYFDVFICDLELQSNIAQMVKEIRASYSRMDVLINNAAMFAATREYSREGIEKTFAVNHLAPFLLTHLLMPLLQNAAHAKVINMSSHAHYSVDFDSRNLQGEKSYNGVDQYCRTKLFNILFTYALADRLKGTRVTVNCVHPGLVSTGLYEQLYIIENAESFQHAADTIVCACTFPEFETQSGLYWTAQAPVLSSAASYKKKYQQMLWKRSEELTGVPAGGYGYGLAAYQPGNCYESFIKLLRKAFFRKYKTTKTMHYSID